MDIDIRRLVPQRSPVLMIDELIDAQETSALTRFTVRTENWFLGQKGELAVPGLIEHMAQSASALEGWKHLLAGNDQPPIGYIGEVKNFHCTRRPMVGEVLFTQVNVELELAGVTMMGCETRVGQEVIATTKLKIALEKQKDVDRE